MLAKIAYVIEMAGLQIGVRATDLILVIQNRCTLADHQRLGLGKPEKR